MVCLLRSFWIKNKSTHTENHSPRRMHISVLHTHYLCVPHQKYAQIHSRICDGKHFPQHTLTLLAHMYSYTAKTGKAIFVGQIVGATTIIARGRRATWFTYIFVFFFRGIFLSIRETAWSRFLLLLISCCFGRRVLGSDTISYMTHITSD